MVLLFDERIFEMTAQQSTTKVDINYPKLPEPKYSRIVDGLPCITIYEHQHLMRAYVDADRAARAPADSVLEDAARYRWLVDYLIDDRYYLDDEIIACASKQELDAVIDAAMAAASKQGANHD